MRHDDDQLRRMFASMNFAGEPPEGTLADDLRRARRGHRRRQVATWAGVTAGVAALGAGVAFAVPNLVSEGEGEIAAAGEESVAEPAACGDGAATDDDLGFSSTRQCLLDVAAQHFDPERVHLPEASENVGTGSGVHGWLVSTKLDWKVPGESGLGMLHVAVSTPGYAEGEYAEYDVAAVIGCEDLADCSHQTVPSTGEEVLVAGPDPDRSLVLGVMYERPDGSFTGVGVYDLFGNNSLEPVSSVDVPLEQAIAFVTDPALQVDASEIGAAEEMLAQELAAAEEADGLREEADFSSTEVVPAPAAYEVTADELRATLDSCIVGVDEWRDFEPVFGLSFQSESNGEGSMLIAERGATKMFCETYTGHAMLFGTSEVKSSPYLRGPVSPIDASFGRHTSDVERVTGQYSGGPQQEAVMKDGYWFLPGTDSGEPVAYRGYDASGDLIYDSTTVDPGACYADPEGEEIIWLGTDDDPGVEDCIRMVEWGF
ncbi:MAG TPA: hypothetical protein VFZ85_20675 [Jiangellaceae bacterium]